MQRKLLRISYLEHKTNDCMRSKINFLLGPQEPPLAAVKRRKLARFGHVTRLTASPKPSFRALYRVGDAVVGRGNAGWTTSRSGHLCPCQNCSQGPPAEKIRRGSLVNRPSCPPRRLRRSQDWTELDWTRKRVIAYFASPACFDLFLKFRLRLRKKETNNCTGSRKVDWYCSIAGGGGGGVVQFCVELTLKVL